MIFVWIKFLICAIVILIAGSRLTRYGDVIAEKTGLCRVWLGLVLLAVITSLPELANGISAAAAAKLPDLAVGDILGACMINMFSLALLDIVFRLRGRRSIFVAPKESNVLSARYGVKLLVLSALGLAFSRYLFDFTVLGISCYSILILLVYFIAQRAIYTHSREAAATGQKQYEHISVANTILLFLAAGALVVAAGSWLPFIGSEIVAVMGWDNTFVAVLFLALATTLPEMTVSVSAMRLGAVGMGIGNLVGSNVFNVMIIFIADAFYTEGSLLSAASSSMIYAALSGSLLMGLVYLALRKKITNNIPSFMIILLYLASLFFLFQAGTLSL